MMQNVSDAFGQTLIFSGILLLAFLLLIRGKKSPLGFSVEVSNEVKGMAILMILLGHIGYFLFNNHDFLFPLSTVSGVGVDLFFLLSGYGLVVSALKRKEKPLDFYKRRFGKIFLPLWLVIVVFLLLDFFVLQRSYDWLTIIKAFLGIFTSADIYQDFNSPFWYLTPLLFYYLLFPWVFRARYAWLSAVLMAVISVVMVGVNLPVTHGVHGLYGLHFLAFPIGMLLASLGHQFKEFGLKMMDSLKPRNMLLVARYVFLLAMGVLFAFTAWQSGDGLTVQLMSIVCGISILLFFSTIKLRSKLFEVLGNYSYEIYLIHWPLMYRYDLIYKFLPAGVGTALYLIWLLGLAVIVRKICSILINRPMVLENKKNL